MDAFNGAPETPAVTVQPETKEDLTAQALQDLEAKLRVERAANTFTIQTPNGPVTLPKEAIGPTLSGQYAGQRTAAGIKSREDVAAANRDATATENVKNRAAAEVRAKISAGALGANAENLPGVLTSKPDSKTANTIDPKTGLTPNAVYQNGIRYALTGVMPAMGMGSKGSVTNARMAIQNTAGALADAAGADIATLQAEYKANSGALSKIVPMYRMTAAFVDTATHNIDLARTQSAKVPRTGSPIVNRYYQWANGQQLTGNPELTKFETYIYTAAREYAKVTQGGAMSAQGLTDSAAKEVQKLVNAAQTPEAFQAATEAMQADMANVVGAQERQINGISSTIGAFLKATVAPRIGEALPTSPQTGGFSVTDPRGVVHTFTSQAAADSFKKAAGIR